MIGPELELLVLDENYQESHRADEIIQNCQNEGLKVVTECSKSIVEINFKPGEPKETLDEMARTLSRVNDIARESGLRVLPIEMPLNYNFVPIIRQSPRYDAKKKLLGEDRFTISGKVMGFHSHYDLNPNDNIKIEQINFLTLVDPFAIAISACSPYKTSGGESFDSWRTHSYRYIVHEEFPFQGDLQKFHQSYDSYLRELETEYVRFVEFSKTKGTNFEDHSTPFNSIWGPVRINLDYSTGELRSMGSNPNIKLLWEAATLIYGGLHLIESGHARDNSSLIKYLLNTNNPKDSFEMIQSLSVDAAQYGFSSEAVTNFCTKVVDFCKIGLTDEENGLISKVENAIYNRRNMANTISGMKGNPQSKYQQLIQIYESTLADISRQYK